LIPFTHALKGVAISELNSPARRGNCIREKYKIINTLEKASPWGELNY
jgi:hypothetical protein